MPAGLQVFNAAGQLQVDITDRLFRFLGSVNTGTSAGSITNTSLTQGSPFAYVLQPGTAPGSFGPAVSISGTTVSWSFPAAAQSPPRPAVASTIFYGIY